MFILGIFLFYVIPIYIIEISIMLLWKGKIKDKIIKRLVVCFLVMGIGQFFITWTIQVGSIESGEHYLEKREILMNNDVTTEEIRKWNDEYTWNTFLNEKTPFDIFISDKYCNSGYIDK